MAIAERCWRALQIEPNCFCCRVLLSEDIERMFPCGWASLEAQMVKHLPAMWETRVWSMGQEDPLEKEMATHSSVLAWKIPWMEDPGGLHTVHGFAKSRTWLSDFTFFPCGYFGYKSLTLHYTGAPSSKAHGGFQKLSALHLQVFPLWESPRWKNSGLQSSLLSFYFPSLPVFCKHCYFSVFRLGFIDLWRYL